MLRLVIEEQESYNDETNEFIPGKKHVLQLEHSLVSLSKWESKWNKPFLTKGEKTIEETADYIRCMTITQNVKPEVYAALTNQNLNDVEAYIGEPMTATTFSKSNHPPNHDIITSEIIYYWMIALNIPFECQKWHLNRLLTLISVCSLKNQPKKKMSRKELTSRNRALNNARRKSMHTKG